MSMEQPSGPNKLSEGSKKLNRTAMEDTNDQNESQQDVDMVDLKTPEEYQMEEYERYYREEQESARKKSLERERIQEDLFSLYKDLKIAQQELDRCDSSFYQELIPIILQNGMFDFTTEIGFVFHKSHFETLCNLLGTERAKEAIHASILTALAALRLSGENKTLQDLVIAAATNEKISLDGLYTVIRMDPTASVLPKPALQK